MNATVMCEKCGKPLGVFDGALCYDCEKAGQEPKSIIREAIEDYVCNYLTDTAKAQKILNALQDMEQEPVLDKIFCIVYPLSIMSTPELEHKAIMQIAEMLEPLCKAESEEQTDAT